MRRLVGGWATSLVLCIVAVGALADTPPEPGPWQITRKIRPIDDLGEFLGVESASGGFRVPAGKKAVRLTVEFYRDGRRLETPRFETSWVDVGPLARRGEWVIQFARGDVVGRVGDASKVVLRSRIAYEGGGAATGGQLLASSFGPRGGAAWTGSLSRAQPDPNRVLVLYKWNAASGSDLNGLTPLSLDELMRRTSNGDLMISWLEAR